MAVQLPNRRKKTPTVIQMEAVECGAAALAIVLAYYKCIVPLEQLREECGVSRDGSKAVNVLKAARRRGMDARGYKHDLRDLGQVRLPAILFWNFNHFVVLEGFGGNGRYFFINDPAMGRRKVAFEEFNESYTGVLLTFDPGPDFQRGGRHPSVLAFLLSRLRSSRDAFIYSLLCALFLVIPGLIIPAFSKIFVDDYLIGTEKSWLRPLLVGMGAAMVMQMLLSGLQEYCLLRFCEKLRLSGSGRFLTHVLRLPMVYFSQRFSGEIGSRLALNDQVASVVGGRLAKICLDVVLLVFFGMLMFLYDPVLAGISLFAAVIGATIVQAIAHVQADRSRVASQAHGKLVGTSMNGLQMIETLKACGGEDEFFGRWAGYQARFLAESQALVAFSQYVMTGPAALNAIFSTLVLSVGAFRIMDGTITLGTFVAFQALASQFSGPFNSLLAFGSNLPMLGANITRINDVFEASEDLLYKSKPEKAPFEGITRLSGRLELRGVSFGYSGLEPPLIKDFDLSLAPGTRVALVGGSGSGKSTIAKLVTGLYRPWSGEIRFDGWTIDEVPRPLFAASVAMVDQEIILFSGTARDNLTFWDASVPERAVHQSCLDAEISQVLVARQGGYRTEIEEGGYNLSGGQRQRLEIARALIHDPTLLILDEATSSLDATTEMMIGRHVRRRGCSCLIIAHRLSTIRDADEIIVMETGRIVERGTFPELYAAKGHLYRLMEQ